MSVMKNDYIRIRMSTQDKEAIKKNAEADGLTISEYIMRLVVVDSAKRSVEKENK